jgi:hypothetical protein
MGVGLAIALGYYFVKKNKAASTASSSGATGTTGGTSTPGGTTTSSLIPQFVNQVYSQPSPPADVTVNNNTTNTPAAVPTPPPEQHKTPQPGYPAPSDFEGWKTSGTSIHLHWNAVIPAPSSYTYIVKDKAGNTKQGTATGTDVDVSGLKKGTGYSVGVFATGGNGTKMGDQTYSYVET